MIQHKEVVEDVHLHLWIIGAIFWVLLPISLVVNGVLDHRAQACVSYKALAEAAIVVDTSKGHFPRNCD